MTLPWTIAITAVVTSFAWAFVFFIADRFFGGGRGR